MENQTTFSKEIIVDDTKLIKFSLWFMFLSLILVCIPFLLLYNFNSLLLGLRKLFIHLIFWLIPIVILHEGLHGLIWALLQKNGFKNIRFGFHKQYFTFYTHCTAPLKKWVFFAGGIAPFTFMGILPVMYGLITESGYWLIWGLINLWTSAADLLVCTKIISLPSNFKILDHPEKLGFYLID